MLIGINLSHNNSWCFLKLVQLHIMVTNTKLHKGSSCVKYVIIWNIKHSYTLTWHITHRNENTMCQATKRSTDLTTHTGHLTQKCENIHSRGKQRYYVQSIHDLVRFLKDKRPVSYAVWRWVWCLARSRSTRLTAATCEPSSGTGQAESTGKCHIISKSLIYISIFSKIILMTMWRKKCIMVCGFFIDIML